MTRASFWTVVVASFLVWLAVALARASGQDGWTPSWTVGDWWEVTYVDRQPFCAAAHVCPPEGHVRERTFLCVVLDRNDLGFELKILEGRDLATTDFLLASYRAEDLANSVDVRRFGRFGAGSSDVPAALFVWPRFPLVVPPAPPSAEEISTLVEALGSEDWEEREGALARFVEFGPQIVERLAGYADHPVLEVRYRIKRIFDTFDPEIAGDAYQGVEAAENGTAFEIRLARGDRMLWRRGDPWYREFERGQPEVKITLVSRKGEAGAGSIDLAEAEAAEAFGRFDAELDLTRKTRLAEEFVSFPEPSVYTTRVIDWLAPSLADRDPDRAIALLERGLLLESGPASTRTSILFELGKVRELRGDRLAAREAWLSVMERAARAEEFDPAGNYQRWALSRLASLELAAGDVEKALEYFARLVEIGTRAEELDAAVKIARIRVSRGEWDEAAGAFQDALAQAPPEAAVEGIRFALGEALEAQGKRDAALAVLDSIRTVGSEWTERARAKRVGSPIAARGLHVIASSYPAPAVSRSESEVRIDAISLHAHSSGGVLVDWGRRVYLWTDPLSDAQGPLDTPAPPRDPRDLPYKAKRDVLGVEIAASERFNRGVAFLGELDADIDGDGASDRIVTVLAAGHLEEKGYPHFFDGEIVAVSGGKLLWRVSRGAPTCPAIVGDMDGDGQPEVAVGCERDGADGSSLVVISADGKRVHEREAPRIRRLELLPAASATRLVLSTESFVEVVDADLRVLWRIERDGAIASVVDLDRDGTSEVVVGARDGSVERFDIDGSALDRIDGLAPVQDLLAVDVGGKAFVLAASAGLSALGLEE